MTIDERLDQLALRHEALAQTVQLIIGMHRDLGQKIDVLTTHLDALTERVDTLTTRVNTVTEQVDRVTERVDIMAQSIQALAQKMEQMIHRDNSIEKKLDRAADLIVRLPEHVSSHEDRLRKIERN